MCFYVELSELVLVTCSISQGSLLGPKNYVMYIKPLGDVIRKHRLRHHCYADDIQMNLSFQPKDDDVQTEALIRIESCLVRYRVLDAPHAQVESRQNRSRAFLL